MKNEKLLSLNYAAGVSGGNTKERAIVRKRTKTGFLFLLTAMLLSALLAAGCAKNPIPPAGTGVTAKSEVFKQATRGLQQDCQRIGCTCTLDGLPTTCALAFACLDAGFCELAKKE